MEEQPELGYLNQKLHIPLRRSQNLYKVNPCLSPESVDFMLCVNYRDLFADPLEVLLKMYSIHAYVIYIA